VLFGSVYDAKLSWAVLLPRTKLVCNVLF